MSKILINVMFNENKGSYAVQEKNIVHEIINLFKADNGKNYIYITRDGKITKAADQELDAILLVRAYCKGVVQVVALAKNVRYIDGEREDSSSIEYGGRTLKDIFYCNTGNNNFYVTFEAKKVLVPKKLLLIASSEDETKEFPEFVDVTIIRKRIRNQSMRLYISDDEYEEQAKKEAFLIIDKLIKNEELWMNADYKTPQLTVSPEIQNNFMNVIGLEDSEIAFSNMISYFFSKYPALFNAFLRQYYKKTMNPIQIDITKMTVEREKNRIDIYITDGTWHIIIENKIKSGINGVEKQKNSEGKYESQLSKYIQSLKNLKPEKENNENGDTPKGVDEKNIRCYLFLPRYATSKIKLDDFKDGDKYKIVDYKMLWDFFAQYLPTIKFQNENEKLFYSFFLDAMSKHTKEHDTDIVERMQRRFMDRINDLNANKE